MTTHTDLKHVFAVCLLAVASATAGAQTSNDAMVAPATANKQAREIARGDPVRWYREDATSQQRWRTKLNAVSA